MDGFEVCRGLKSEPRTISQCGSSIASRWLYSTRSPGCTIASIWRTISPHSSDASRRGKPLSILLIDIDHFKAATTATAMAPGTRCCENSPTGPGAARGIDLVCRLGGEEFVVVMPDCDLDMAVHVGERLRQCIAAGPLRERRRLGAGTFRRYARAYFEAGRPGALLREAGRPQPGGRRCRLSSIFAGRNAPNQVKFSTLATSLDLPRRLKPLG
jgi:hypothetical protein